MINENQLIREIKKMGGKGCKYSSIDYVDSKGIRSKYLILIGTKYENALKYDLKFLTRLRAAVPVDDSPKSVAIDELINSVNASLTRNHDVSSTRTYYKHICDGVYQHKFTKAYYVYGTLQHKKILKPSTKKVKSSPIVVEKEQIRSRLKTDYFRTFRMEGINQVHINGKVIDQLI